MPPPPTLHLAPTGADAGVLAAGIAERAGGRVETVRAERRTVLDTFDWRLHRGGFALERVESNDGDQLVLRGWGQAAPAVTVAWDGGPPTFAPDLPAGRLRDAVAPLLDVRALIEITDYDATQHVVVVRNDDDKVVARAAVDDLGAGTGLVRHLPVRGYDRAGARLVDAVAASRCAATTVDPLDVALERDGRTPGDRGGRLAIALDPDGPAAAGWLVVLRA